MKLVDLLPSRASSPFRCRECDDTLDQLGPDCAECSGAGLVQRLEWRYQNDEGITPLGSFAGVAFTREFHPLHFTASVDFRFGREWFIAVALGFWALVVQPDI